MDYPHLLYLSGKSILIFLTHPHFILIFILTFRCVSPNEIRGIIENEDK